MRPGLILSEQAHCRQGGMPLDLSLSEQAHRRRGTLPLGLRLGGRLGGYSRRQVRLPFGGAYAEQASPSDDADLETAELPCIDTVDLLAKRGDAAGPAFGSVWLTAASVICLSIAASSAVILSTST